jgi:integrase/recombinase XerD
MSLISKAMPVGVTPTLGPDATGVGHVFWYTVESATLSQRELRSIQPDRALPDDRVFVSEQGRPLTRTAITMIVAQAAKRAGIEAHVSAHWMRHAHASHAIDNGAAITLVQRTLGHVSIQTTSAYIHARPDESSGKYLR